ncbi:MAG: bifunctional phosphopantothenoylcysteine decarboxylase/phosphopantothenate--cysteine ligase CoaBC [Hadesarchaea archaeon]|nr:bifunctional phosphopantothenoylcysteine decarboxylase/phosphopantothenate--cysteine ligase CoaBC [Hadesarchaea archaeon]MDH5685363.1 bifunctional phosphopantothenoylcysteine decarboxylase/phosphopantothenate--cysteine ligase CoaBC [Hadesarchaea archaeon]
MHPSHDIKGTKGKELERQKIVLCITGSVAAVKCPELARELMRHGADVRACMTPSAIGLITPQLMHWATGNEVVTEITGKIEHIELARWADLVLVAPATANTLGKMAHAIDDTPVTSVVSVALGLEKPIVAVPAMHESMYQHKLFQENLAKLRSAGVHMLEPKIEEGKAKLASIEEVVQSVIELLGPRDMEGMRVLVTAGPTVEPIDPIKLITNRSSGKMGVAVARVAASRGAEATLIYGPGTEAPPPNVKVVRVQTTREMCEAFKRELKSPHDIIVSTAAAQDFVIEQPAEQKLRHSKPLTLKLVPAPRVLDEARKLAPNAFVVGFKAEFNVSDEELLAAAREKLSEGLDMVVANDVARPGAGFGSETNEVIIITSSGSKVMRATKVEIAKAILDAAMARLRGRG